METLSFSLARALREFTDLRLVALAGRRDGRPPTMWRLALFLASSTLGVLRERRTTDVLIVGDFLLAFIAVIRRMIDRSVRIVIIVHGLDVLFGRRKGALPRLYDRYVRSMVAVLRRSDVTIVANSNASAAAARTCGLDVAEVIPLGVDLGHFDGRHSEFRDPDVVLFVGRLVARKGAGWFCENVLPRLPGTTLVVIGPSTDAAEARRITAHHRVEYLGVVSDDELARHRRRAWIAVVPNQPVRALDIEGFGLTAVESAAAGCVTVASKIDGLVDALDQEVAYLVEPSDAEAWADRIRQVQAWTPQRHSEFVSKSMVRLRSKNSWSAVARALLSAGASDGQVAANGPESGLPEESEPESEPPE